MTPTSPILAAAAAYIAGLLLTSLPGLRPPFPPFPALFIAALLALSPFAATGSGARSDRRGGLALSRAAILLAFLLCGSAARQDGPPGALASDPALGDHLDTNRPIRLEGTLLRSRVTPEGRLRLVLDLRRAAGRAVRTDGPRGVRLSVYGKEELERARALLPGDRLILFATIGRPRSFGNPGALDYPGFLHRRGIALLGAVKSPLRIEAAGRDAPSAARALTALRRSLLRALRAATGDGPAAGLVAAMAWGERDAISPAQRKTMVEGGTFHLVAISGLHVGLVAWSLLVAGRTLGGGRRAPRLVVLLVLPAYAVLTGGNPPVVRAASMGVAMAAAGLVGRRAAAWNALGLAGLVAAIGDPGALAGAGLRMSFAATASILLLAAPIARRLPGPRFLAGSLGASVAAFAGVVPVVAAEAHRVAPVAIAANLPAVPLAGVAVLSGGLATLLQPLCAPAASLAAAPAVLAARAILALSRAAAAVPGGSWPSPAPAAGVTAGYFALLLLLALPAPRPLRRTCGALLILGAGAILAGPPGAGPTGTLRLDLIDVGQGDAVLIRMPDGRAVLVDAGGFAGSSFDVGARVVVPTLWHLGVRRLDVAVGTHPHRDHVGGLPAVVDSIPTGEVWLATGAADHPDTAALRRACLRRGVGLRRVVAGVRRRFGAVSLEVLHPAAGFPRGDANESSVVLRLRLGRRCLLLTGDAGGPAEQALLRDGPPGRCDVLKVGHHGSSTATTERFARDLSPRLALISVGGGNRWEHPDPDVERRLTGSGARVLRTDRHGLVTVETDGERLWWFARRGAGTVSRR